MTADIREAMQLALEIIEQAKGYGITSAYNASAAAALRAALSEPKKCKYGDQSCPCQDGDMCHYEGENPMTPPASEPLQEPVAWMNASGMTISHAQKMQIFADGADGGEWKIAADVVERYDRPLYAAPPEGYVLVPVEPTAAMISAMMTSQAVDCEGTFPMLMDHLVYSGENESRTVLKAAYKAMLEAAKGGE